VEGDGAYLSPLAAWRQLHFGTTANAGPAANGADPDGDGVSNLMEYAFQQLPNSAASRTVPTFVNSGGAFYLQFPNPDPTGAKLLSFTVSATADLASPQWIHLSDEDPGSGYLFGLLMAGNPRAFFRVHVTADAGM
jgi:hypothetical protein